MPRDIRPYTVEVQAADGSWHEQDLVRGRREAVNTARRALDLHSPTRIKDRFGFIEAEFPTPKARGEA